MDEKKKQELIQMLSSFIQQEKNDRRAEELSEKLRQIQLFNPQKQQEGK